MGGCRGKLGRPRCRPRWDTHLNSRSLLNWNSSLAATAAGSVKKCTNGQVKTIWLPFSGSHKKINAAASYKTGFRLSELLDCGIRMLLLRLYLVHCDQLRRFFETIDLLVSKRNHYNKETKMRKSRTTLR